MISHERRDARMFDPNDGFMYVIVALVIVFVIAESVYFLIKAWRRARQLGLSTAVLKKTAATAAVFTIAPAVAILLGVIALSKALGFPFPWLRLSVIGALTYETTAAAAAAAAQGYSLATLITDAKVFATIAWVMTVGIIPGLVLVPLFSRKIEQGLLKIKSTDQKWSEIFMAALFLGMISAFLGMIFSRIREGLTGWIPVLVMLTAALLMAGCGLMVRKFKVRWMEDYALPISMLGAMALAIPITRFVQQLAS
jgi:hypothetical protein